jgi:hypothetical protein
MQNATIGTALVLYFLAFKIWLSVVFKWFRNLKKSRFFIATAGSLCGNENGGVFPAVVVTASVRRH